MPETTPRATFRVSLRARFILVITLVLLAVFSLTAFALLHNARRSLTADLNNNSKAFAALATRPIGDAYLVYQSYGSLRVHQEINKFTTLNNNISNVGILGLDGQLQYAVNGKLAGAISAATATSFKPTYIPGSSAAYATVVQPYFDTNGQHQFAVVYTVSTAQLEQSIKRQFQTIIIFSLLGLLIAAAVTYWLINRLFLRPLEGVSRASLAISDGNYSQQIDSPRNDEIGDLAKSVNQMATNLKNDIFKLQEVDTMKNEFIMITSHNLRTPLTVIEGYMEIIHESELPDDMRHMMGAIEDGLRSLASFSEDILTIASIESGNASLTVRHTTIDELMKGLHDSYQAMADQKSIQLDWQIEQSETGLEVSATHIRGVLRNLLDNAIKFSDKGGEVRLSVRPQGADLILEVTDKGIGIAPEEMPKLFTKFHRGTSTYTYNYEGTGIGLYATKLIVQAHKGKVTASSSLGKGSTFTVLLPGVVHPV